VARSGYAESADAKERRARTACLAGDYAEGVRLLSELFVSTKDTTFIFNQGRCFEQNRRYEDAIARFQEFLRASKKVTKADKAEAQKHINDCKDLLADGGEKSKAAQPAPVAPTPVTPVAPTAVVPPPVVPTPAPSTPVVTSKANGSAGSGLRTAGIVTASAGGAALVAGLILNLKANNLADEFDNNQDPATKSSHSSYKTASMICYGVGAGAVIAGTALYLFGRSGSGESGDRLSFVPVLTPSEFSLGVRRHF
jgi:tetratricopeptide (TPR) repeat protein